VNNFLKKPLDFMAKMGYIITMKEMKNIDKDTVLAIASLTYTITLLLVAIIALALTQ
jgi:hypothetical protein